MGSRSNNDLAYIAGFLDGDGSLMLQIKKRHDGKKKWRFMATICFYQDSRHEASLSWIRSVLGIGYLSKRNDGMSELRINGFKQVQGILEKLMPFIKFKDEQARALHNATEILTKTQDSQSLKKLVDCILKIQEHNYVAKRKKTKQELYSLLDLTP
ncbi:MAG: LAGLIDADG family homing endonuclease [bacterium]|nr:LAGLIDADG family homing endonuclease [bacterium]